MAYLLLAVAIGAEILATTLLKYSEGFTKLLPTLGSLVTYGICYTAFSRAITKINLGIAYATWCGVGILVTTGISFLVFKEELSVFGLVGIFFIVIGCIMVNLTPG